MARFIRIYIKAFYSCQLKTQVDLASLQENMIKRLESLLYIIHKIWYSYNTGLQKIFPRINFHYSVSFSPDEYEYESHLFLSRLEFQKFYDKGLKINKIGCLYVGCFLAETNQQFQYFAYLKCFSRNTFHSYVPFQA